MTATTAPFRITRMNALSSKCFPSGTVGNNSTVITSDPYHPASFHCQTYTEATGGNSSR